MHAAPWRALPARVTLVLIGSLVSSYGYLMTVTRRGRQRTAVRGAGRPARAHRHVARLDRDRRRPRAWRRSPQCLGIRLGVGHVAIPVLTGVTVAAARAVRAPRRRHRACGGPSFGVGTTVMMLGAVVMFRGGFGGVRPRQRDVRARPVARHHAGAGQDRPRGRDGADGLPPSAVGSGWARWRWRCRSARCSRSGCVACRPWPAVRRHPPQGTRVTRARPTG